MGRSLGFCKFFLRLLLYLVAIILTLNLLEGREILLSKSTLSLPTRSINRTVGKYKARQVNG